MAVDKRSLIDALRCLSDKRYQRQAWLASSGPVVSSFVEDTCQLFDDTGLSDALARREIVFGEEVDAKLREFAGIVANIEGNVDPSQLIEGQDTARIRVFGTSILTMIAGKMGGRS